MKTINEIDRSVAKAIGETIEYHLKEMAKKHGLTIKYSGCRFTPESMTAKIDITVAAPDGSAQTKHEIEWNKYAAAYGMKTSWLGKTFTVAGKLLTIRGLRTGKAKNNVIVTVKSGKEYVVPHHEVIGYMKRSK